MMGWISLLKEKESLPIKEIEKDIKRLNLISERFSKVGSIPNLESQEINSVIEQTTSYLKKRSSEHILFEIKLPQKEVILPFNSQLISWTLENLIKNGIDAMKGKGRLSVQMIEQKSKVEIYICDSGSGIKDELLPSIFNPGFTTKERGWGLGLSLAKRIVEDFHNGKIIVNKNRQSQGTCFQILLNKS